MDSATRFLIVDDRRGVPGRQQRFEVAQNLWHQTYAEARDRLRVLI